MQISARCRQLTLTGTRRCLVRPFETDPSVVPKLAYIEALVVFMLR